MEEMEKPYEEIDIDANLGHCPHPLPRHSMSNGFQRRRTSNARASYQKLVQILKPRNCSRAKLSKIGTDIKTPKLFPCQVIKNRYRY